MAKSFQFDTDYYKPIELRNSEEETHRKLLSGISQSNCLKPKIKRTSKKQSEIFKDIQRNEDKNYSQRLIRNN